MGFNKVCKSLQELFPQIDARVLRAVAIEHSKDADAAVETVLVEIIPFFTERSRPSAPLNGSVSVGESSEALAGAIATKTVDGSHVNAGQSGEAQNDRNIDGGNQQSVHNADEHNEPFYDTYDQHQGEGTTAEFASSEKVIENSSQMEADVHSHAEAQLAVQHGVDNTLQVEVTGVAEMEEAVKDNKCPESNIIISSDNIPCHTLGTPQEVGVRINQNTNLCKENVHCGDLEAEFQSATSKEIDQGKSSADGNIAVVDPASLTVHDLTTGHPESSVPLVILPDIRKSDLKELDAYLSNTDSKIDINSNSVGTEEESTLNASISQSSQIQIMDVLEEIIADARNNKKTLFSAMESVISLMREVERKEQAAEQAKVEAAMGGADILVKVEELKAMLRHAKEANDMHAGEVYGEKAILATELRELQSRVLSLSNEREKSLAVLDEMRQTLEVRLAAAENEIKLAELEKVEKGKYAMKALADQELILEKVMQESRILKQQAEDNAKLQEFLVDRGRFVDMLQGEISVICQDVRLLKEKFDDRLPLSKSLSSSQTSCILASSSSSSKSSIQDQVELVPDRTDSLETRNETFFDQPSSQEPAGGDDRKALLDDGWEIFDDPEISAA